MKFIPPVILSMSLRAGLLLLPTKQSPVIRRLLRLTCPGGRCQGKPRAPRSDMFIRLGKQSKPHVIETIKRLLPMLSKEPVDKQLWIVEEDRIRVRE